MITEINFVTDFFWNTCRAALVAMVLFSLPGLAVLRWLGLLATLRSLSVLLTAPAIGLCTYGSFSLLFSSITDYSTLTIFVIWLFFQGMILLWQDKQPPYDTDHFCHISNLKSLFILIGAMLWSASATVQIFPVMYQGGLFVNPPIFDHAKVAIVDAIVRDGLLPINPYYAPDGQTIPLIYYYTWHFLASQLKLLAGVTGWQAEVAMNWFTGFATIAFLCALAIRFTQRARAGLLLLLFAWATSPIDLLPSLLGPHLENWFSIPPGHGLEVLWNQMMWVPQHILSALAVILAIFFTTHILIHDRFQMNYTVSLALSGATAFGSSTWVGGIGLFMVFPFLVGMGLRLCLPKENYLMTLKALMLAIFICAIVIFPLLLSQSSGPPSSFLPFGWGIYPSTRLFPLGPQSGEIIAHIIMFWIQFLPLNLGISYLLGLLALFARSSPLLEERTFQALNIGGVIGYLLVTQFVQSTFWNNTFGWRAVLVPVMLLLVWSAIAFTELSTCHFSAVTKWRSNAWLVRWKSALLPITVVGLTVGILSFLRIWSLPDPSYFPPPPEVITLHQGFFRQYYAWEKVREYARPHDRVQANPDGYASLTPWPATLPYALFADRSTAYANVEYATVFAHRYDQEQNLQQYQLIQNIFSEHPTQEALQKIRDQLKVKVLLIDKTDAVWPLDTIEKSGLYRLVYVNAYFKILVANGL